MGICLDRVGRNQSTGLRWNVAGVEYWRPLVHCCRCRIGHVYFATRIGVRPSPQRRGLERLVLVGCHVGIAHLVG